MRQPDFGLCVNKGADQVRSNCEADQRLCFHRRIVQFLYFLNLKPSSVLEQLSLCHTWSETRRPVFSRCGSYDFDPPCSSFGFSVNLNMSRPMGKPTICIGENKGADQRLCFCYSDSTIPLLLKSEISSI